MLARYQFSVTDEFGHVVPAAVVEVRRDAVGGPPVQLFSDRNGLDAIGNPIKADSDGFVFFHCDGGLYQITATSGAFTRVWRDVPIGLIAETDRTLQGPGVSFPLIFSSTTADADPGAGAIALNQVTQNTATVAYVDLADADLADITAMLESLDDVGALARIQRDRCRHVGEWLLQARGLDRQSERSQSVREQ
jgi:hypothetical protein